MEPHTKKRLWRDLLLSLLFDGIGMLTYGVLGLGEIGDVVWAPVAAFIIYRMYAKHGGWAGSILTLLEEGLPGTDFIPSFLIMWCYTYLIRRDHANDRPVQRNRN